MSECDAKAHSRRGIADQSLPSGSEVSAFRSLSSPALRQPTHLLLEVPKRVIVGVSQEMLDSRVGSAYPVLDVVHEVGAITLKGGAVRWRREGSFIR